MRPERLTNTSDGQMPRKKDNKTKLNDIKPGAFHVGFFYFCTNETRCAFEKENKKVVHRTINIRIFN